MERDAFLGRVRQAQDASTLPASSDAGGPLVWAPPGGNLVEQFVANLEAVDGVAHRTTQTGAADIVVDVFRRHGASACLAWSDEQLGAEGVIAAIKAAEVEVIDPTVPPGPQARLDHQAAYDAVTVGVTGTVAGLAESGTVVLSAGEGRSRMASLIPLVHVAILDASTIHASLSHFAAAHPNAGADTTNLIFITGPSRTGDIETHLNLGVHGPRHVHVIVVEE